MAGYTKLFPGLILSTVWREPNHIRLVWITMLAITDRDGLYGAVKFARACQRSGIAPVVGVDHTMADGSRAVSLATSRQGWASLCRLTSAVHLAGERGKPRCTPEAMAGHDDDLVRGG